VRRRKRTHFYFGRGRLKAVIDKVRSYGLGLSKKEHILYVCKQCKTSYSDTKSHSSLRMTYCSIMCETNDLGFHIDSFLKIPSRKRVSEEEPMPVHAEVDDDDDFRDLVFA